MQAINYLTLSVRRLRHEDIPVLGQFRAEVITLCLYPYIKCFCGVMKKISQKNSAGSTNHNNFLGPGIALNLKLVQSFQVSIHLHPCHPL